MTVANIRHNLHQQLMYLKIAGVVIMIIMSFINAGLHTPHKLRGYPIAFGVIGALCLIAAIMLRQTNVRISMGLVVAFVICVLLGSLPSSIFVREKPAEFVVECIVVGFFALAFVVYMIYQNQQENCGTFRALCDANISTLIAVPLVSVLLFALLQSSGVIEASFDVITPEHVKNVSEKIIVSTPNVHPDTTILYYREEATWNNITIGALMLAGIVILTGLLYLMSLSIGLMNCTTQSPHSCPQQQHILTKAIVFSICMNAPYLLIYYFTNKWAGGNKHIGFDASWGIEFMFVCLKFILFFYVMVALDMFVIHKPSMSMYDGVKIDTKDNMFDMQGMLRFIEHGAIGGLFL